MRIAILGHDYRAAGGGGVENYLREVAPRLARAGHEVLVLARRWSVDQPEVELRAGVAVHSVAFPEVRGLAVLLKPRLVARRLVGPVRERLEAFRPDVVVSRFAQLAWAANRACPGRIRLFMPPCLETQQARSGRASSPWRERLLVALWRWQTDAVEGEALRASTGVVVFSQNMVRQILERHSPLSAAPEVNPPGVDGVRFSPGGDRQLRGRHGASDGDVVVLGLGRLRAEKGFVGLLRSALASPERRWHLWLVGDGPDGEALRALARGAAHVVVEAATGNPAEWYRAADVLAMPSSYEAFGQVLLEALASGLPVVARRSRPPDVLTAADEIVEEGRTGLLADGADDGAFIGLVDRLARDRELRRRMGAEARASALARFSWERHLAALLAFAGRLGA